MALQTYIVEYESSPSVYTALSNVQAVNITMGRQAQLDQYSASTATIELRYPTGYVSPITALVPGLLMRIRTSTALLMYGYISNVTVNYGIPYAGGVGNADRLIINLETQFALAGRMQANNYAMPAGTISYQFGLAATESGIPFDWDATYQTNPQMAGTTITGSWGDWLNKALLTVNGRLVDIIYSVVAGLSPFYIRTSTVNFSDTANDATNQVYDIIEFHSLADNYYTQATVDPEGFAAQTVTKSGAVKPYRTLLFNTFNASTSQATDFANYLLNNYGNTATSIASISCQAESQNVFKLDALDAGYFGSLIGLRTSVIFRGTTYPCVIEGASVSATPAGSRYTYYLSGDELNAYLLLNNTVFGTLDNNKLGY